uniref:Myotubularin phosphatase domain-containing protein n=1 Tax=Heterorhabditis bacteriophora TaxID=37862 RepID=A0A1I7X9N2_HETBA
MFIYYKKQITCYLVVYQSRECSQTSIDLFLKAIHEELCWYYDHWFQVDDTMFWTQVAPELPKNGGIPMLYCLCDEPKLAYGLAKRKETGYAYVLDRRGERIKESPPEGVLIDGRRFCFITMR